MLDEIILYTIIAIFIGVSQSAGVGGGPVLNICLMIGAGYSTKSSMSITYVFLMGGATASIIKNFGRIMPGQKTFVMDYNLIIITLPMIASGSLFGTLSNHYFSEFAVTILFVILLVYLCVNTYNKLKNSSQATGQIKSPLLTQNTQLQIMQTGGTQPNAELSQILRQQLNPLPKQKIAVLIFVFFCTLVTLIFKGGHHYESMIGLKSCGTAGNLLVFAHTALSFYISKKMAQKYIQIDQKKESLGYNFQRESDKMNNKKMWSSIISGFAAGLIGGALGLGGAIVLVPVWLNSGIDKQRAVSTSPPLIFFSAFISFTVCYLAGRYKNFMELFFFFGLAYLGSALVKKCVQIIVNKYQLKTMIFILLLITMASSLVTLVPYQILKFIKDSQGFMRFGQFC